jgi:type I restriction enzyme S subunit
MSEEILPKGWKVVKFKDVTTIIGGGTPSTSIEEYFDGDIPWLSPVDLSGYKEKYISRGRKNISKLGLQKSSARLLPINTVLFSSRAPIGYVAIADKEMATNQGFKNLLPSSSFEPSFAYYYLKHKKDYIESQASGTTFKEISGKKLGEIDFILPPLPEQQRIVAKLDAVFGHLDSLREKLDRIPELLKNFRQQVLTKAVTGELTREWREGKDLGEWEENLVKFLIDRETSFYENQKKENRKTRKPEYLNYSISDFKKSDITGWAKGPIGLFCDSIVPGRDKPKGFTGNIPWVTMPILNSEFINEEDANLYLSEEEIEEVKAKIIPKGSVVMSIVGRFGIASILNCDAVINQQLHAFLPSPILLPEFLLYQIKTSEKYLNDISTSTTVAYVNKTNANSLPVNIPPIEEQQEIIKRIDELFSLADKIESQYQSLKAKIDQLPQAILGKAFRGELVGQEVKEYVREIGELGMVAEGVKTFEVSKTSKV